MTSTFLKSTAISLCAFLLFSCGETTSSEKESDVYVTAETANTPVPAVEGSPEEIAGVWCELMRKEFRAKNGGDKDEIARTSADVTAYQKNIEEMFADEPLVIENILKAMANCDAAMVGKER